MNKETFEKLGLHVSTINWSVRTETVFRNANFERIIDIYIGQENNGGYPKKTDRSWENRGLLKYRNFGRGSLADVELKFSEHGLPNLRDGTTVVEEFHRAEANPTLLTGVTFVSDLLATEIITGVLKALGRKHGPEIILQVMAIV